MQDCQTPSEYLSQPHLYPLLSKKENKKLENENLKNELYISIIYYLNHFHPSQCRIEVISPTFKNRPNNRLANYYGTEYYTYSLPEQSKLWEFIFSQHLFSRISPDNKVINQFILIYYIYYLVLYYRSFNAYCSFFFFFFFIKLFIS